MSQKCFLTDVETVRKRARVRIAQLGGKTDFSPDWLLARSRAGYVEGETLVDMIREGLIAECLAIDSREIEPYTRPRAEFFYDL